MEILTKLIDRDFKKNQKKTKIVLTHTSREYKEYLVSLKKRFSGEYVKIPHYLILKNGKVLNLLEDFKCPIFFNQDQLNKNSIIISLENFGWLEKLPLKNYYINWIGSIYKEKPFERKWRDYVNWHPYTDIQIIQTANLCKELSKKYEINLKCIGHNTKVKGAENFEGIITESNFNLFTNKVSPAFDFEKFEKLLKNE